MRRREDSVPKQGAVGRGLGQSPRRSLRRTHVARRADAVRSGVWSPDAARARFWRGGVRAAGLANANARARGCGQGARRRAAAFGEEGGVWGRSCFRAESELRVGQRTPQRTPEQRRKSTWPPRVWRQDWTRWAWAGGGGESTGGGAGQTALWVGAGSCPEELEAREEPAAGRLPVCAEGLKRLRTPPELGGGWELGRGSLSVPRGAFSETHGAGDLHTAGMAFVTLDLSWAPL